MSKNAVIALACQIVKLREAARMWKQTAQAHKDQRDIQAANHETRMAELRSSMGVRIDADAQLITSLQAMVKEQSNSAKAAGDLLGWTENESPLQAVERVVKERDALRAEVADLKTQLERLTSWAAKNQAARETLQTEIERLKSQTPKHPVKVGEWVRRTDAECESIHWGLGVVAQVMDVYSAEQRYNVTRPDWNGDFVPWDWELCTPCDPPTADHDTPEGLSVAESVIRNDRNTEPKPGDTVRLVRVPTPGPDFDGLIDFPWNTDWGAVGDVAAVVATLAPTDLPVAAVRVSSGIVVWWPLSCVEVVRTEPDEIKVGDLVEVVSNRGRNTWLADVGSLGTVTSVEEINESISVCLDDVPGKQNALAGYVSLCDVRKVTT